MDVGRRGVIPRLPVHQVGDADVPPLELTGGRIDLDPNDPAANLILG